MNRRKIKRHLCYIMLSLFLSSIISCSSGERDGEAPSADATVQKIDIEMKSADISLSASNYTEIYLKISGPDIEPAIEKTTEDITTPIQFSIYVPPGGKRMFLAQARDSSKNVIFEGSLIKDIEPDVPITINIFISPGDYSISGRILLSSGVGLVGAEVTLSGRGQNIPGPVHTDCSGAYTFSGLYNGDYTITSSMTGFKFDRDSIDVTVKDGDVTGQDFKSKVSETIYVDSNGSCIPSPCDGSKDKPYKTIQEGINNAPDGDTVIKVAGDDGSEGGRYKESITMRSYITLEGRWNNDFSKRDFKTNITTIYEEYQLPNAPLVVFDDVLSAVIDGFTISDGSSATNGGGIAINSSCSIAVTHNTITYNEADSNGGGIYLASSGSVVIENNFITDNWSGGGIYIIKSSSNITNNTISNNSFGECAPGSGVYVDSGTINIKNSIIWDNCEPFDNTDLYVVTPGSVTVTYSDIRWTNIDINTPPNTNNISEPPQFKSFNDYHIKLDSPCKDKGTPDGAPKYDIDGEQRPYGEGFDIGADEYYGE